MLKKWFPIDSPLAALCILLIQSDIWVFGSIQIFHSLSMYVQFAKAPLFICEILEG